MHFYCNLTAKNYTSHLSNILLVKNPVNRKQVLTKQFSIINDTIANHRQQFSLYPQFNNNDKRHTLQLHTIVIIFQS